MRSVHPRFGGRPSIDLASLAPSTSADTFLGGSSGKVHLFDTRGALTRTMSHGDSQEDVFVAWHPDGKRFASADGQDVRLWRVGEADPYAVVSVGATLLVASDGALLGLVDHSMVTRISFDNGSVLETRALSSMVPEAPGARPRGVGAFGFLLCDDAGVWLVNHTKATKLVTPLANAMWVAGAADAPRVAAANATSVVVEDVATGAVVRTFSLDNAVALTLSPDGTRLALALRDERVVYGVDSGEVLSRWREGSGVIGRTVQALMGDTLVGSTGGSFARANVVTGAEVGLERRFAERLSSLAFSPDGARLAVLAANEVVLFDGSSGASKDSLPLPAPLTTWSVGSLAFLSNTEVCIAGDGRLFTLDLDSRAVRPLGEPNRELALFRTTRGLMAVVDRTEVVVVDTKTGALGAPLASVRCASAAISPDGASLLFEDDDSGTFKVRPIGAGKAASVGTKLRGLPVFTSDGKPAVANREGDGIEVPGKPKKTYEVPCESARAFAWSPDGSSVALIDGGDGVFLVDLN